MWKKAVTCTRQIFNLVEISLTMLVLDFGTLEDQTIAIEQLIPIWILLITCVWGVVQLHSETKIA